MKPTSWAYPAIRYSVENKLIAVDYSTYDKEASAPRQDVAYALYKLTNGRDNEPDRLPCTQYIPQDMQNSPDEYKYSVQWAVENEIIAGIKNEGDHDSTSYKTWFAPHNIVTREQMAGLLHRLAGHDGLDTLNYNTILLNGYADGGKTAGWAKDSMAWCVMNGLMKGIGDNRLDPKGTLTYAQLAQLVMMYGELKAEAGIVTEPTPGPKYYPNYYEIERLPVSGYTTRYGTYWPERQDTRWFFDETGNSGLGITTGYWQNIKDLSGPWDKCEALTDWIPVGGYIKDDHRYNKYDVCIDDVDGLPTNDEKKAFIVLNQHRINNDLPPLEWDQAAQVMVEVRSLEQNTLPKMAHTRPDGSGFSSIVNECNDIGIMSIKEHSGWACENLYCSNIYEPTYRTSGAMVTFIASVGHNNAFLAPEANYGALSDLGGMTCYVGLQMN